tara:strand:+ start:359 stop:640 length:282 start_codon:yes stop_codon:yes gene_type:complete
MVKQNKEFDVLKKQMKEYADKVRTIQLNPDKKQLDTTLNGLLNRKEKFKEIYCPCRVVTGNKEKDKEIICPCVFHRGEIELQGHCLCKLFFQK